jgi:hypothetical protein
MKSILLILLSFLFNYNLSAQKAGIDYNFYKNAESLLLKNERLIYTGIDNLVLYPLEFFDIGTFTGFYGGAAGTEIINFEINQKQKKSILSLLAGDVELGKAIKVKLNNDVVDGFNFIDIKLAMDEEPIIRRIKYGQKYKIIYSFHRDDILNRGKYGQPIDRSDGYEIIDIVPYYDKFPRQFKWNP